MSELIRELRHYAKLTAEGSTSDTLEKDTIYWIAADEIERLLAELAAERERMDWVLGNCDDPWIEDREQIDKRRAAAIRERPEVKNDV